MGVCFIVVGFTGTKFDGSIARGRRIATPRGAATPALLKKLASAANKHPGYFGEHPVDVFRRNVWINPFWEDDVKELARHMPVERMMFGSDWPHTNTTLDRVTTYPQMLQALTGSAPTSSSMMVATLPFSSTRAVSLNLLVLFQQQLPLTATNMA